MPDGTPEGRRRDPGLQMGQRHRAGDAARSDPVPPPPNACRSTASRPRSRRSSAPGRSGSAVSPDGKTLLVALGLADQAAVIDTDTKQSRYVNTGSHPFGAAIMPEGKPG